MYAYVTLPSSGGNSSLRWISGLLSRIQPSETVGVGEGLGDEVGEAEVECEEAELFGVEVHAEVISAATIQTAKILILMRRL